MAWSKYANVSHQYARETTKEGTKVMAQFTGSVTFQYNSQSYVVGQTSDLVTMPGVGG